jgi:hypothetical protein
MLAYIAATYDVRLEKGSEKPPNKWFGTACIPANSPLAFRKRQT